MQEICCIFSVSILILMGIAYHSGEKVKEMSSMFRLGNQGLSLTTMLEFLAMAVIITFLRYFLFSEAWLKQASVIPRTILMIVCIVFITAVFATVFAWFPINEWRAWIGFAISFGICFSGGTILMIVKNNLENRKMKEGLEKLKQEMQEGKQSE